MDLARQYQTLLDKHFETSFPSWNRFSPLDPIRLFADSLSYALASVEERQSRFLNCVLDSLPSLFGFHPHEARLPRIVLQLEASPTLKASARLDAGTLFPFEGEEPTLYARLVSAVRIDPVVLVSAVSTERTLRVHLKSTGECESVRLSFLPKYKLPRAPRFCVEESSREVEIETITEEHGGLSLELQFQETLKEGDEIALVLRPEDIEAHGGTLALHRTIAEVFELKATLDLGDLKAEPWEELKLHPSIAEAPSKLFIHFPSAAAEELTRIEDRFLLSRHVDARNVQKGYFYNGANHSLVVPDAHRLGGAHRGGMHASAEEVVLLPTNLTVLEAREASVGLFSSILDKARFLSVASESVPRENTAAFLSRFYTALRLLHPATTAISLSARDLETLLYNRLPEARVIEIAGREDGNHFNVYIHTAGPEETPSTLSPALVTRVEQILAEVLPLGTTWRIGSFDTEHLTFLSKDTGSGEALKKALLPPPFGGSVADNVQTMAELFPKDPSVVCVRGTGECVETLARRAGLWFIVHIPSEGGAR